jgi:hypothetical protein
MQRTSILHWFCGTCEKPALTAVRNEKLVEEKCNSLFATFRADLEEHFTKQLDALKAELVQMKALVEDKRSQPESFRDILMKEAAASESEVASLQQTFIENSAKEIADRENRKDKVVWFGVPESDENEATRRKEADLDFVSKLGTSVFGFNDKDVFRDARRLGKKGDRARPLLTTLDTGRRVGEVLKGAHLLSKSQDYRNISVKKDMTPLEREEMRKLVKVRNEKREESKQKQTGDVWVIRKGRVVNITRRPQAVIGEGGEGDAE